MKENEIPLEGIGISKQEHTDLDIKNLEIIDKNKF